MDTGLPPAPQIDGEAMLEIFVHHSIRFPNAPMNTDSPYGDGQRLRTIGHRMLDAAYTSVMFDKRPMLNAEDLQVRRAIPSQIACLTQSGLGGGRRETS